LHSATGEGLLSQNPVAAGQIEVNRSALRNKK